MEMSCVKPSARMQVDFVGTTPSRKKPDGNANGTSRLTAGNAGNARGRRLRGAGHGQFLQVVHEDLQADVVGEDGGPRLLEPRHKQQRLKNMSGTLQHAAAQLKMTQITLQI